MKALFKCRDSVCHHSLEARAVWLVVGNIRVRDKTYRFGYSLQLFKLAVGHSRAEWRDRVIISD